MRVALSFPAIGARWGGAETYVGALARTLAAAGHDVHVLASQVDAEELPSSVQVHLLPTHERTMGWFHPYRFAAAADRELTRQACDLAFGFGQVWRQDVYVAIGGSRPALQAGSRLRFHSGMVRAGWRLGQLANPRQWVQRSIERKTFARGRAPFVVVPSQRVADDFRRWHDVPADRLAVVPLGIELRRLDDQDLGRRENFRAQLGLQPNDVAILFSARNYSLKGLEPLLEAFATVARDCSQAQLLVCGAEREQKYRSRAAQLGIEGRVRFLGFLADTQACLAGADVFALPSFYDACSLAVLEALAAGLPVVTTRADGAAELVSEGRDGFVIDSPWALNQLSDRLLQLVRYPQLRQQLGQQARRGARRLSIEASVQALLRTLHAHKLWRPAEWNRRRAA